MSLPAEQLPASGPAPRFADEQVRGELLRALRAGVPWHVAAKLARVSRTALQEWRARGAEAQRLAEAGQPVPTTELPYLQLVEDMEHARAMAHARAVTLVAQAGDEDWRAAAWMLERISPEDWNLTRRTELTGLDGAPLQLDVRAAVVSVDVNDTERTRQVLLAMADAGMLEVPDDAVDDS